MRFTRDTLTALAAGLLMIVLSLLMIPFSGDSMTDKIISFFLRDLLMIFGLGVVFVSVYSDRKGKAVLSDMGFTRNNILLSLILDIVFASGLAAMFLKECLLIYLISPIFMQHYIFLRQASLR